MPIISCSSIGRFSISNNTNCFQIPGFIFLFFFRLQDSEKIKRPLNWHQRLMSLPKQGILNNLLFKNGFGKTTRLAPVFSFLKNALYLNVDVFCTKILIEGTVFSSPTVDGAAILRIVIRATRRSTRVQGKGSTFIFQLF